MLAAMRIFERVLHGVVVLAIVSAALIIMAIIAVSLFVSTFLQLQGEKI